MPFATPALGDHDDHAADISRRAVFAGAAIAAIGAASGAMAQETALVRRGTPQLTLGPFYPLTRPPEEDADLTTMFGVPGRAQGVIMGLVGRITNEAGAPVPGAQLDIWQTNSLGRYHHPSDPSGAPWDPAFQGAAILRADGEGRYRLRTVIPAPYQNRQRHIHFDVRGRNRRLITQMFFPGEPNQRDYLYQSLRTEALQAAVTATRLGEQDGVVAFEWNIALAAE